MNGLISYYLKKVETIVKVVKRFLKFTEILLFMI